MGVDVSSNKCLWIVFLITFPEMETVEMHKKREEWWVQSRFWGKGMFVFVFCLQR